MKNIQVKTMGVRNAINYKDNQKAATVFLRHDEDRITVVSGEQVNIEIYNNGQPVFLGSKTEFFELLKEHKTKTK